MIFQKVSLADAARAFALSMDVQLAQQEPHYLRSFDTPFQKWLWGRVLGGPLYRFGCEGYKALDANGRLTGYLFVRAGRYGMAGVDLVAAPDRPRGTHFGVTAMDFMMGLAAERGLPFVFGSVTHTNKSAVSLYHMPRFGPLPLCDDTLDLTDSATFLRARPAPASASRVRPLRGWQKPAAGAAAREFAVGDSRIENCLAHDFLPYVFFSGLKGWILEGEDGAKGYLIFERLTDGIILHLYSDERLWGTPAEVQALAQIGRELLEGRPDHSLTVTVGSPAHHESLAGPLQQLGFAPGRLYRRMMLLQVEAWRRHVQQEGGDSHHATG